MAISNDEQIASEIRMKLNSQDNQKQENSEKPKGHRKTMEQAGQTNTASLVQPNHMLYVQSKVNGHHVEMLIDSGATMSVISSEMVTRLNLSHRLNRSLEGVAVGVGSAEILGVVEDVRCRMGPVKFRLVLIVLEASKPFLILGLDQMRRLKCCIDLVDNRLIFGGHHGTGISFLPRKLAAQAVNSMFMPEEQQKETSRTAHHHHQSTLQQEKNSSKQEPCPQGCEKQSQKQEQSGSTSPLKKREQQQHPSKSKQRRLKKQERTKAPQWS